MTRVELGKGSGSKSTINIFDAGICKKTWCPYGGADPYCEPYDGGRVIIFQRGVTRYTRAEVENKAPCVNPRNVL